LQTRDWKTSAGIGLIFQADIGKWLAGSVAAWKIGKIPRRREALERKMAISDFQAGKWAGWKSVFSSDIGKWLAGWSDAFSNTRCLTVQYFRLL